MMVIMCKSTEVFQIIKNFNHVSTNTIFEIYTPNLQCRNILIFLKTLKLVKHPINYDTDE